MRSDHTARQVTVSDSGEPFAGDWTGPAFTELQQRIRDLVDELRYGILDAITKTSAAEIAELMRTADLVRGRPLITEARAAPSQPHTNGGGARRLGRNSQDPHQDKGSDPRASLYALQDPFDITSPGELLASTQEHRAARSASGPAVSGAPFSFDPLPSSTSDLSSSFDDIAQSGHVPSVLLERHPHESPPAPSESAVALPGSDREAESERRPRIVLREGERLLSATGSGVVIRRERRISPPR